jgi:hypothetical protein
VQNRSFLACHFCCQRFKPINRRVIAKHIITNGGFVHRLAHGRVGWVTVSLRRSIIASEKFLDEICYSTRTIACSRTAMARWRAFVVQKAGLSDGSHCFFD